MHGENPATTVPLLPHRCSHPPTGPRSFRDFSPAIRRRKGFSITFRRRFCSALFALEPTFTCGSPPRSLGEKLTSTPILYLSIVCESPCRGTCVFSRLLASRLFLPLRTREIAFFQEMYSWCGRGAGYRTYGGDKLWRVLRSLRGAQSRRRGSQKNIKTIL